jgi:predicted ATPase/class 3 adenylate cyclase
MPDGERKTVTALFADIKGSTELMRDLDPEEARAIVDPVLHLMMAAIHRYGGYVAQSTGDGIFALFGAPAAHEDHPQRALHAALAMQEELRRYAERLRAEGKVPVEARVGVNTGEVVLRTIETGGHPEYTPIGHVTNLAARMQTAAPSGSIAVSETTRRLCEGYFTFRDLGQTEVKGITEPVHIYQVAGLGPLRTHFQLSAQRGFTKFVGREHEMAAMRRAYEQAVHGHGQVVSIVAEAGTGKSRLIHEFAEALPSECKILKAYSVPHGGASAWLPVLELLRSYFGIGDADEKPARREKVEAKLAALDSVLNDTLPYLCTLMGLAEDANPLVQMNPQLRRRRTSDALKRIVIRESLKQPLVLIFEDLHWIDSETQAMLDSFIDAIASTRVLLLVDYRPEYRHNWTGKSYYTQFSLAPLGAEGATEMLDALLGSEPALRPLKKLIAEKTEGNPFFIEEIVQALFDQGTLARNGEVKLTRSLSEVNIPPTVQGILASRIDRLAPEAKELLQTLAVMGKNLPLGLIKRVTAKGEDKLEGMLSDLQTREFIYEQPAPSELAYAFKHALTQEVTYNSLLIGRRKVLHERVANQIESLFKSRLEDYYGDLARHYRRSENRQKSIEYLQLAGQQAIQRSANAEAINYLTDALKIVRAVPDAPKRTQQELVLLTMLGPALIATKGNGAMEVRAVYEAAVELARQRGENARLFPVLFGLRSSHLVRGELRQASELGEQLLILANTLQDVGLTVEANLAQGHTLSLLGEFASSLAHLDAAVAIYDPRKHHAHAFQYGLDPAVFCLCRASLVLWYLGHPDLAIKRIEQAIALAREPPLHYFSLAVALLNADVYRHCGNGQLAQHSAEAAIDLCEQQGFTNFLGQATVHRGAALAFQGHAEEGVQLINQGLAMCRTTGAVAFETMYLTDLAEACRTAMLFEEGLRALAEAFAIAEKTGERIYEAELYRLKGELTLMQKTKYSASDVEREVEECFGKALEISSRQQAKSFELRAVMSLSRLWQQVGKSAQARQLLAEIYGWFSEGLETKDLKDAKALLAQLS